MVRLIACLMLLLAVTAGRASAQSPGPGGSGANDPSIVLGLVATLSGPGALSGQDMVDGFNLALRQLGGRFANHEVRVVVADDKGSPDMGVQQARRLMERERLDMVLTAVSPSSLAAMAPVLTGARLFVLSLQAPPPSMAGAECSPYLFDLAASGAGYHEAMGQHLAAEQVGRLAVVAPDTPLTAAAVAALKRTFPGEIVATLQLRPGTAVFDDQLRRLREIRPDAVYSLLTGGMGVAFVRAFDAAGLKPDMPLFATWTAVEQPTLAGLGEAALDLVSIGTWSPDLDSIPNKRLVTDFEAEYGRPATTWAAQGYDAVFLIDSALRATHGRTGDHDAVRAGLRRADFVSVRGAFRFNTNHVPSLAYHVRKVARDARGRLTHELRGVVLKDWRDQAAAACPMRWVEEVPATPPGRKP